MDRLPPAERAAASVMRPVPHVVAGKRQESHDTWTLVLEPARKGIAPFAPGQFAMLYCFGVGEIPVSFSGEPDGGRLRHTVRAVGDASGAICSLQEGAYIGVRGPFGSGWPIAQAAGRDVIVLAGGIGLARARGRRDHTAGGGAIRPGQRDGIRVRARGDDALRDHRAA